MIASHCMAAGLDDRGHAGTRPDISATFHLSVKEQRKERSPDAF